jgi:4-hydroxybenzoate polyprenyltransferase
MNAITNIIRLLRPRQWVKSGFVFMGLLFSHGWTQPSLRARVIMAAIAFSLVSSGVYILNDLFDRNNDAQHKRKRVRPLASGAVSVRTAVVVLAIIWIAGFALGGTISLPVLFILGLYALLNIGYSMGLKHVVVLDVFIIAAGFILRLLAGTTGVGIAPSNWILLCGMMTALFLGFAKRRSELYTQAGNPAGHRRVIQQYQPVFLDKMIVITATCVIISYGLYTLSPATIAFHHTESLIYTLPFVIYGVFRYIYALHTHTTGSDPAHDLFNDPHLVFSITGWLVLTIWIIRST